MKKIFSLKLNESLFKDGYSQKKKNIKLCIESYCGELALTLRAYNTKTRLDFK